MERMICKICANEKCICEYIDWDGYDVHEEFSGVPTLPLLVGLSNHPYLFIPQLQASHMERDFDSQVAL